MCQVILAAFSSFQRPPSSEEHVWQVQSMLAEAQTHSTCVARAERGDVTAAFSRHPSKSPPKKAARWRGRSARGRPSPRAPENSTASAPHTGNGLLPSCAPVMSSLFLPPTVFADAHKAALPIASLLYKFYNDWNTSARFEKELLAPMDGLP